ncbi:hypothetical protein [Lentisalinibacter salinarum]|uniref:hypothetical protein n=1 Tax=Lentisalinibacter salinarum TaxID=2992239 RepID=UPI0038653F9A
MAGGIADNQPKSDLLRLEALTGAWETERVESLAPDGTVDRVSPARAHNGFQLDGRVFVHRGWLLDPAIETIGWYFIDPSDGRLHWSTVESSGRHDEFVGGWQDGRLVMVNVPQSSADPQRFRMTHFEITGNSYLETLEVSEDGGISWRVTSRQVMRRTSASNLLAALGRYVGRWRSDEKTTGSGAKQHFMLDLTWVDAHRTITRVTISQVDADGNVTTVFEGYKGREPSGSGIYYHAASPPGRGSRGKVVIEQDRLVTVYDGWTAGGDTVRIRDVFEPVRADRFSSRTCLRRPGEVGWRLIAEDQWTKVE